MQEVGADTLLVVTENRSGNATQWVTGWPGTVEAFTVFRPGEKMWMTVEWVNHYPAGGEDVQPHGRRLGPAPRAGEAAR